MLLIPNVLHSERVNAEDLGQGAECPQVVPTHIQPENGLLNVFQDGRTLQIRQSLSKKRRLVL